MPVPQVWAVLFFFMIILVGIDSQVRFTTTRQSQQADNIPCNITSVRGRGGLLDRPHRHVSHTASRLPTRTQHRSLLLRLLPPRPLHDDAGDVTLRQKHDSTMIGSA